MTVCIELIFINFDLSFGMFKCYSVYIYIHLRFLVFKVFEVFVLLFKCRNLVIDVQVFVLFWMFKRLLVLWVFDVFVLLFKCLYFSGSFSF